MSVQKNPFICSYLLFTVVFATVYCTQTDDSSIIVNTQSGKVRGIKKVTSSGKQVDAFLGIPFAQPPLGALRFQPPIAKDPWQDILDASQQPKSCYQQKDDLANNFTRSPTFHLNTDQSEDCLYLNIWLPTPRPTNAAVMVYIYGGAFVSGSISLEVYDGSTLAAEENVIVVTVQYRLGALGFMYLGTEAVPGNAGMYDQVMALKWVRDNIPSFGGDQNRVTLFGNSAGAASIHLHLLSPLFRDLFQFAILQSGAATTPWAVVTSNVARNRSLQLMERLACPDEECMKSVDPQRIINNEMLTKGLLVFPFVPVVDGRFLPDVPDRMMKAGQFKHTSILLGTTQNEGLLFLLTTVDKFKKPKPNLEFSRQDLKERLEESFSLIFNQSTRDAIVQHYSNASSEDDATENVRLLDKAIGDYGITCAVEGLAESYGEVGSKVYKYLFTHQSAYHNWPKWMGVLHASEIEYVFGWPLDNGRNFTDKEAELSRHMMRYWANFAKNGNPNADQNTTWAEFNSAERPLLILNLNLTMQNGRPDDDCAFWDRTRSA